MSQEKDQIYAEPCDMIADFRFDAQVAEVCPDMIRRSVPGYDTTTPLLGLFADPGFHCFNFAAMCAIK